MLVDQLVLELFHESVVVALGLARLCGAHAAQRLPGGLGLARQAGAWRVPFARISAVRDHVAERCAGGRVEANVVGRTDATVLKELAPGRVGIAVEHGGQTVHAEEHDEDLEQALQDRTNETTG